MPTPKGFYPLASPDGQAIPFDVGEASGLIIQSYTDAASSELDLPTEDCVLVIFSTGRVIVSFGEISPSRAEGVFSTDLLFVPANTQVTVKPNVLKLKVMALEVGGTGKVMIQVFTRWQALAADALQQRY